MSAKRYWTEQEENIIRENFNTLSNKEIADKLEHTEVSVRLHRLLLGHNRHNKAHATSYEPQSIGDLNNIYSINNQESKTFAYMMVALLLVIVSNKSRVVGSDLKAGLDGKYTLTMSFQNDASK